MGLYSCEKHGTHAATLVCEHLSDLLFQNEKLSEVQAIDGIVSYQVDILDDGDVMLSCHCCKECACGFGVERHHVFTGDQFDDGVTLPEVSPTCALCLAEIGVDDL